MPSIRLTQASLAAAAVGLLGFAIPAVNKYISHENCLESTGSPSFELLPGQLNQALCSFNVTFMAANSTPAGALLVNAFGSFFACAALILVYHRGAKSALVLLIGQIVPICIVYPAYQAMASPATAKRTAAQAWVALFAVGLGYILPGSSAVNSGLAYGPLSLWQIYPVPILALTVLLPSIISPLNALGRKIPILVIAAVGFWISQWGYAPLIPALLSGEVSASQLFYPPADSFASTALWVFIVDFVIVMLSAVHATVAPHGLTTVLWLAIGVAFGPGAGLMAVWGYKELTK